MESTSEWLSKNYSSIKFIIALVFAASFLFSMIQINSTTRWNGIFIESNLGLLTFVSLFYSLVLKKEVAKKRESLLIRKWGEYLPQFKKHLTNLQKESGKSQPSYSTLLKISENIQEKLNDMALFEIEINIGRQIFHSVLAFIASLMLFLLDSTTEFILTLGTNQIALRFFGYLFFIYATYRAVELVLTWSRINSTQ